MTKKWHYFCLRMFFIQKHDSSSLTKKKVLNNKRLITSILLYMNLKLHNLTSTPSLYVSLLTLMSFSVIFHILNMYMRKLGSIRMDKIFNTQTMITFLELLKSGSDQDKDETNPMTHYLVFVSRSTLNMFYE